MNTLSSSEMRKIIAHLDRALGDIAVNDARRVGILGYEGLAAWSVREARAHLMRAAIGEVTVEQGEAEVHG